MHNRGSWKLIEFLFRTKNKRNLKKSCVKSSIHFGIKNLSVSSELIALSVVAGARVASPF
jgi:hypothetical protein